MPRKPTYEELEQRIKELEKGFAETKPSGEELSEAESIRQLLKFAPFGIYLIDLSGKIVTANKMGAEHFGKRVEKIIGTTLREYFPQAVAENKRAKGIEVVTSGKPVNFEDRVGDRWYSNSIFPVFDHKGKISLLAVYGGDITDFKLKEEALRESEEKYRLLIESAAEGIVLTQEGKVRYVNPRAVEFIGYSEEEIKAESMLHFFHPDDRERLTQLYLKKVTGGEVPPGMSWRMMDKNGTIKTVQSRSTALTWEGKPSLLTFLIDITQQRKAEEALREQSEFSRLVIDNAGEGICICHAAEEFPFVHFTVWNQRMNSITGYSMDEINRLGWYQTMYPDPEYQKRAIARMEAMRSGDNLQSEEWEISRSDGQKRTLLITTRLLTESRTSQPYVLAVMSDITDRKRAEEALRESEKRYRHLVENTSEAILVIQDGMVKFANSKTVAAFGYSEEELLSRPVFELIHPEDRDTVIRRHRQKIDGDTKPTRRTYRVIHKSSQIRWIEISSVLIEWDARPATLNLIRDITERKRAEEVLRESEERYRTILGSIAEGYYEVDLAGNLTFFNDSVCELLGYSRNELIGMNNRHYTDAEGAKELYRTFNKVYTTGKPTRGFDWEIIRKDGAKRVVEASVTLMRNEQGNPIGFRGIVRDVTDRKRAEEERQRLEAQLQQAQKMEAIGTLAGGIAHDFNNLLMGIQGRASLIMTEIDSSHPHYEHLRGIEEYVQSAADLTKQLLGFARGGKYEVKVTDLSELAERSASLFGRTKKEICIHRKFQPDLWTVEVDRNQIEQVLLNLFVNAWQAMPAGGEIYLETQNVVLEEAYVKPLGLKPGTYVKLSVTDTGVGMDGQTKQRLFDPFFTTKGMGRGTGLGLASAYGIIKNHEGLITVYSEKGHGSTFNIYLPASGKGVSGGTEPLGDIVKGQGTILLVDDEDLILEIGKPLLERLGYTVLLAKGGKEAIEVYRENLHQIKMVILDMIMPQMSGGETFDRLRAINPRVKVLLSSGYSISGHAQEILKRGCRGFIQKPFNLRELSQRVGELLGKP